MKTKIIKLLESLREIFSGLGLGSLLSYKLKAQETKKYIHWTSSKLKLCASKTITQLVKRQPTE